jgi:hypothetical protein
MSTETAARITVIEDHQSSWPLTVVNAVAYLDYAVAMNIPRVQLHAEPYMKRILKRSYQSKKFFAQVFMSGTFKKPMTSQHDGFWGILDDDTIPKAAICCWRGFGKSSGIVAMSVWSIVFQMEKFILIVGKSHDHASTITENIKLELFCNRKIRAVFGTFRQRKAEEMENADLIDFDLMFSRRGWFACDPETGEASCFIMPKGVGQQVRGLQIRIGDQIWRVTLGIVDDLEDKSEMDNDKLRKKTKEWFHEDLIPVTDDEQPVAAGVNKGRWNLANGRRPPWRWIYIDTMKHPDSLMMQLINSYEWRTKIYPWCELRVDADGKARYYSLVPERASHMQVREKVKGERERGAMNGFYREYMCRPMNLENASWVKDGYVRYHEHDAQLSRMNAVTRFVICDPARTAESDSCPTGMLAFGIDAHEHQLWVRDEINDRLNIIDGSLSRTAIDFCVRTNSQVLLVEVDGGDDFIRREFMEAVAARGANIQLMWINAKKKTTEGEYMPGAEGRKQRDAQGTIRWYKSKQIKHEWKLKDGPLEKAQQAFPYPSEWDSLDCLGHLTRALDLMKIYFEYRAPVETGELFGDETINMETYKRIKAYNESNPQYANVTDYNHGLRNVA